MDVATVDILREGLWREVPDERIRGEFKAHLKRSAYPEEFPGIALRKKPPPDRRFRIIARGITVDAERREGTLVPCNLCGPAPKFCKEGILIVDNLGWGYLVGPVCARKHYADGRFNIEWNRFSKDEARRAATDYLLNLAPLAPHLAAYARELIPYVDAAASIHAALRTIPSITELLRSAICRHDGWLQVSVTREVVGANGRSRTEHEQVNVAQIVGRAAVTVKFALDVKFRQATEFLALFGTDEDSAMEFISAAEREDGVIRADASLRKSTDNLRKVSASLSEFADFVSPQNFRAISAYANDPRGTIRFSIVAAAGGYYLKPEGDFRAMIRADLLQSPLPPIPENLLEILATRDPDPKP